MLEVLSGEELLQLPVLAMIHKDTIVLDHLLPGSNLLTIMMSLLSRPDLRLTRIFVLLCLSQFKVNKVVSYLTKGTWLKCTNFVNNTRYC